MKKGIIYLVGAGPGDPGLFTIKGKSVMETADVVVFDRLVSKRILAYAPQGAEMIYVGKKAGEHVMSQDDINAVLAQKAEAGKTVVRLKGGDPFLFGRGGEEAQYIRERGLDFEIVPGITSAAAAPAYAGIPLTHRDNNSSLTIIAGHESPEKNQSSVNWELLGKSKGTLVFLMGVKNLRFICRRLMECGKDADTPAALIRWGTWPEQLVLTGRLDTVARLAEERNIRPPAVIVIGKVVEMREQLAWLEKKPLWGKKIVVTRTRAQAGVMAEKIQALGGEAIEFPVIAVERETDLKNLHNALKNINHYDWLIFTSVNGVNIFWDEVIKYGLDIRAFYDIKIAAIGAATRKALEGRGLKVQSVPAEFRAEGMVEALSKEIAGGQWALLPRARGARTLLPDSLRGRGVRVNEIYLYQAVTDAGTNHTLRDDIIKGAFDYLTFTSSSAVDNFVKIIGQENAVTLDKKVRVSCIGPVTADTAEKYGFTVHVRADVYTVDGLLEAVMDDVKVQRGNDF
ncbi:MAG: uroporphyrinogen-III C-methyltransferase [Syntrophomonadaceae bacterium]|jgi:uroporphyrinogen III methyltransferase/synthase|nr:uroporphyrinogen-III C-methyltransferase [Syntrophomonadaceae bacterium]